MAAPDVVTVALGVEATRPSAVEALGAASEAASALLSAVHSEGVASTDVRTSTLTLAHHHVIMGDQLHVMSFIAATSFTVIVRDIGRVAGLIDAAISAAGDSGRIHWLSYRFADDADLERRAREQAFADARMKAEHYAQLSGLTLGPVTTISEGGHIGIITRTASSGSTMPVSPGEQAATADVTVVFETSQGKAEG
jgi:uncharacterized protein YggE